jgi:cytochrome c-type biogenesis protein CcmH/NrfG
MADDYDQWMQMGNEYYAKNDHKAARECWANAEKLRTPEYQARRDYTQRRYSEGS